MSTPKSTAIGRLTPKRTIVAYWDLARPLALIRPIESVNPKGDLRRRVPDADFTANGKYGGAFSFMLIIHPARD